MRALHRAFHYGFSVCQIFHVSSVRARYHKWRIRNVKLFLRGNMKLLKHFIFDETALNCIFHVCSYIDSHLRMQAHRALITPSKTITTVLFFRVERLEPKDFFFSFTWYSLDLSNYFKPVNRWILLIGVCFKFEQIYRPIGLKWFKKSK